MCRFILSVFACFFTIMGRGHAQMVQPDWNLYTSHARFLASDQLQGRGTGTPGGEKAAQYIADQLSSFGLVPAQENYSFYQYIPMHRSRPLSGTILTITSPGSASPETLHVSDDFLIYRGGNQASLVQPVPLIFVGYGIVAPEYDYDDYQDINVAGKIVLFLEGEPASADPEFFKGDQSTGYAYVEAKQRIAISKGALGTILVMECPESDETWARYQREFYFEDVSLAYQVAGPLSLLLHPRRIRQLTRNTLSACDLYEEVRQFRYQPRELPVQLSFTGYFQNQDFLSANVVGLVPAVKNRREEAVLISAHYDHLGIGMPVYGDSIYNGLQDNALGVAMVLELARYFALHPDLIQRDLIFLLTTGEEKGLLGAQYYVDHPLRPLYKTSANLNIDGVASIDAFREVIGVGAELSDLGMLLYKIATLNGLREVHIPPGFQKNESFARSDQIAFARGGIPAINILDGPAYKNLPDEQGFQVLREWFENYYHSPFDDLSQSISREGITQHFDLLRQYIELITNYTGKIEWNPNTEYYHIRLQTVAEKR